MLKRKDLAKEFELVVKQEVINHNKQIEAQNQRMLKLESKHSELWERFHDESYQKTAHINCLSLEKEKLKKELLDQKNSYESKILGLEKRFKNRMDDLEAKLDFQNKKTFAKEEINKFYEYQDKKIQENKMNLEDHIKEVERSLEKSKMDLKSYIQMMYLTLKEMTFDLYEDVKTIHKEDISSLKIEKDGVQKELNLFKKSLFILEKHVEFFRNEIKKMKEGPK